MFRLLSILLGVAVLLTTGIVHGLWTDRWRPSQELAEAGAKLASLPNDFKDWKGELYEPEAEQLDVSGAAANYSRHFTDPVTGEKVLVIILAGKPARMSVHRPEHCYQAAGYELSGKPIKITVTPAKEPGTEMWTGLFVRSDPVKGTQQLRIFWTWYAAGKWQAPENPRWAFAQQPVLYKVYVIRSVSEAAPLAADPCLRLLGEMLPVLNRKL